MAINGHSKADSDATSLAPTSPPRSPRRHTPAYYVMSPYHSPYGGSTPGASPFSHPAAGYFVPSPVPHSRESCDSLFSAPNKTAAVRGGWEKLSHAVPRGGKDGSRRSRDGSEAFEEEEEGAPPAKWFVGVAIFVLGFVAFFSLFSLVLWCASKPYKPRVLIQSVVFENYNVHGGVDFAGVPTKMLSINCTVQMSVHNTATYFGIHVSSSPWDLYYYNLKIASGTMHGFYQPRKSSWVVRTAVGGAQVPLYGGGSELRSRSTDGGPPEVVPLRLEFTVRARAHVLGGLVKTEFHRLVRCELVLDESRIGKPVSDHRRSCTYTEL